MIYDDIGKRTDGNIYIGVVGPVRTGKSTFIKRFIDTFILPAIENEYERKRIIDQMPQSGDGKTITTTEPKFIPANAVVISTENDVKLKVRLVDCVGYLIPGVLGHMEDGKERLVSTPWSEEKIPFSNAANIGTEKVIKDHSTVGIVVTTDGSIVELSRENYVESEERAINQLKQLNKPFVIVVNSTNPEGENTRELVKSLEEKYGVAVKAFNCMTMGEKEFSALFESILLQFPALQVDFILPSYLEALSIDHWINETIINSAKNWMDTFTTMGQVIDTASRLVDGKVIKGVKILNGDLSKGRITIEAELEPALYYKVVEELLDTAVRNDKELFILLKEYSAAKKGFDNIREALMEVEKNNYGIVAPKISEMYLDKPEIFKQGNKYGVRLKAKASCLHIIRTDISTEVSPLVGSESQSEDLAQYLSEQFDNGECNIWETNIFGKTLKDMITEQMGNKAQNIPLSLRGKVQKSLQKISDEGKDYFICIIL